MQFPTPFRLLPLLPMLFHIEAAELKVDINRETKNNDSQTEPGYVKWSQSSYDGATSAAGTTGITRSFTTAGGEQVSITFAQTPASLASGGTGLTFIYYGTAVDGTAKLIGDGITVAPANFGGGGQIRMTIVGLEAGSHTLLTYHNAGDALAPGSLGPIDIFANGTQVADNVPQTIRLLDRPLAGYSYISFEVSGTDDPAEFVFAADPTEGSHLVRNPMINGFEIDTPNVFHSATNPVPADGDGHVDADAGTTTLSWTGAQAGDTASRNIYLGTDLNAIRQATPTSPEYLGNQLSNSKTVAISDSHATYYWRVDEIKTSGTITRGSIWSFRPRHLAFPGAQGWGRFARGGRRGQVVHVTRLDDYPSGVAPVPGTLRHAIEQGTGPRTIVFDVGGMITLARRLTLSDDFVTIAGQTAPGKGICIRQYALGLSGSNDSIVRFIRNRPGDISGETIDGGGLAGCDHSIMDHCSISWSIDEAFSGRGAKNITLQNTLISEALNIAGHQNYPAGTKHGYAATIGGDVASYHHNLLAHCEGRNWSLGGGLDASGFFAGRLDIRNNVVYNWGNRTTDGGAHEVNFVNNYYKPGPASTIFTALNAQYDNFPGTQQYHMAGNVMPGHFTAASQSAGRTASPSNGGSLPSYPIWLSSPFFDSHVTTETAESAFRSVLSDVGCNQPALDKHDQRVIAETLTGATTYQGTGPYGGSPGLPNSQNDVGGWETYPEEIRQISWDADGDGLPGWWEEILGSNSSSAPGSLTDAWNDSDGDGFTALEDYLDWMASPHGFTRPGQPLRFDLRPFAAGFTAWSVLIGETTNGSVTLLENGTVAEFEPESGFSGLASIAFTVTGNGASKSWNVNIAISANDLLQERRYAGEDGIWNENALVWRSGSLQSAWQAGSRAVFPDQGEAIQTIVIDGAIVAKDMRVDGQYRFTGSGSLTLQEGAEITGRSLFRAPLGLSSGGTWISAGTLDFLGFGTTPTFPLTTEGGGIIITPDNFRIASLHHTGGSSTITLYLPVGRSYQLQSTTDLAESNWQNVPGQLRDGSDAMASFTEVTPTPGHRFYRVKAIEP